MSSSDPLRRNPLSDAAWLYPIWGIPYFLSHRFFWPLLHRRLVTIFILSAIVYTILFLFTYLPQVAFLAIFQGAGAWVNGAILVLGEGAAIVALLFEAFFVDETLVDIFDAVMIHKGFETLVAQKRALNPNTDDPVKKLGKPTEKAVYSPFSLRQIIEFIILLPLNFVPVVGVPLFLVLTGYRAGPFHHWRYFQLLDFSKDHRNRFIRHRKLRYTAFGTVAVSLQLVPGLSMLFLLTTATGSALWAAEMQKRKQDLVERQATTAPAGLNPEYRDDPVDPVLVHV